MITEATSNTRKCYNCSIIWQYDDEDIQESITYDPIYGKIKNTFIRCPKCNSALTIY